MDSRDAEQAFKNVTLINFNYDRVLEHFLYSALQRKYGLNSSTSARVISGLSVIRPYDRVGALPWQVNEDSSVEQVIPFGATPNNNDQISLAQNIKTFTEHGVSDSSIVPILEKARVVVFLGFGFHLQNMQLLRVRDSVPWRRTFATVMGISAGRRAAPDGKEGEHAGNRSSGASSGIKPRRSPLDEVAAVPDRAQGRERSPPDAMRPRPRARRQGRWPSRTVGLLGAIFAYAPGGVMRPADVGGRAMMNT
jgi:hypothetical protein